MKDGLLLGDVMIATSVVETGSARDFCCWLKARCGSVEVLELFIGLKPGDLKHNTGTWTKIVMGKLLLGHSKALLLLIEGFGSTPAQPFVSIEHISQFTNVCFTHTVTRGSRTPGSCEFKL
ncbi:hypothetical protein E2542_SST02816 [Spatholobus suberectus]|nr:hypothetical protein E2542_SST02816 [Spatholobus suberectus]